MCVCFSCSSSLVAKRIWIKKQEKTGVLREGGEGKNRKEKNLFILVRMIIERVQMCAGWNKSNFDLEHDDYYHYDQLTIPNRRIFLLISLFYSFFSVPRDFFSTNVTNRAQCCSVACSRSRSLSLAVSFFFSFSLSLSRSLPLFRAFSNFLFSIPTAATNTLHFLFLR